MLFLKIEGCNCTCFTRSKVSPAIKCAIINSSQNTECACNFDKFMNENICFQNLQLIGSFATCEKFWQIYCHLVRPGDLTSHSDFHLFKKGIKPLWEDEANRYGGKYTYSALNQKNNIFSFTHAEKNIFSKSVPFIFVGT